MTLKHKDGLSYSLGTADDGIMTNIDMMAHDNPSIAATARLNRDLIAAIEKWFDDEKERETNPLDCMIASMHGVITVCGTILTNVPSNHRIKASQAMRAELLGIFDAMTKAVIEGEPDGQ